MEQNHPAADGVEPCRWCGEQHGKLCPWVKAFEFDPTGQIVVRVEFVTPADMGPPQRAEPEPGDYPRKPSKG